MMPDALTLGLAASAAGAVAALFFSDPPAGAGTEKKTAYTPKDFSKLLGMSGFSDTMLNNHFKLYQGYVKNSNLVDEKALQLCMAGQTAVPEFAELKRRFGWEFNGMRLHELYFGNLGGNGQIDSKSLLLKQIEKDFMKFDNWKFDFIGVGSMRGIGWTVAYWEPVARKLVNCWINEHDTGHMAGCTPVLVMDCFEHAYMTDYQLDRKSYIEAFLKNVDWSMASDRYFDANRRI